MTLIELFCGKEDLKYDTGNITNKVSRAFRINQIREEFSTAINKFFQIIIKLTGTCDKKAAVNSLRQTAKGLKQYVVELIDGLFAYIDVFYTTILSVVTYKPRLTVHFIAIVSTNSNAQIQYYAVQRCLPGKHIPYRHQTRGSDDLPPKMIKL